MNELGSRKIYCGLLGGEMYAKILSYLHGMNIEFKIR